MFIERAAFHQVNPTGDAYVKGQIAIEGEFTISEWEGIRELFIACGLLQNLRKGRRLSEIIPSQREILDAFRDEELHSLAKKYPGFNWSGKTNESKPPPPKPKAWPQKLLEDKK